MATENGGGRDYVHPTPVTAWQLIGGVVSLVAIIVASLWTIVTSENANNKSITDDLKNNYVVNSRHNDLEARITRELARVDHDVARIDKGNDQVHETSVSRTEFDRWERERTRTLDLLQRQVDQTTSRVETVIRDRASTESIAALQKQIDLLTKHIDDISAREDKRHIKDGDK